MTTYQQFNHHVPVVVTNCELRFGFNVACSLSKNNIPVIAMGRSRFNMSSGLPSIMACRTYPNPFIDPEGYIDCINEAVSNLPQVFLIPSHEDIFVASKYKANFSPQITVLADTFSQLMRFHDKWSLLELCQTSDLTYPTTYIYNANLIPNHMQGKLILKPRFGEGSRGIVTTTVDKLTASPPQFKEPYLIQTKIKGIGIGVGIFADQGDLLAISGHKRLRELPRTGGTSCARQSFDDPVLFKKVEKLIELTKFSGIMMLEFKYDGTSGSYHMLDANPRYWGGVSTHILSGVDYPTIQYLHATGSLKLKDIARINQGIESRWLMGEITYFFDSLIRRDWTSCREIISTNDNTFFEDLSDYAGISAFLKQLLSYISRYNDKFGKIPYQERIKFFNDI